MIHKQLQMHDTHKEIGEAAMCSEQNANKVCSEHIDWLVLALPLHVIGAAEPIVYSFHSCNMLACVSHDRQWLSATFAFVIAWHSKQCWQACGSHVWLPAHLAFGCCFLLVRGS